MRRNRTGRRSGIDLGTVEIIGVLDDERLARRHVIAHEQTEDLVGLFGVLHADTAQHARTRIHGGVGELVGIHLTQALVALNVIVIGDMFALELGKFAGQLVIGIGIDCLLYTSDAADE